VYPYRRIKKRLTFKLIRENDIIKQDNTKLEAANANIKFKCIIELVFLFKL
jgi:hypothetical protein